MTSSVPELNLPWVDSPFFDALLKTSDLDEQTKQQVKHFADYGYLILDLELDNFDKIADQIILEMQNLAEEEGITDGVVVASDRIQNAWRVSAGIKAIATAPKILDWLRILYRREPIPFHTLNFAEGTEQKTHSDSIHFSSIPARFMCGVWVALEDIDAENGPLHYYPGSHKLPLYDLHDLGFCGSFENRPYKNYRTYEAFVQQIIQHKNLEKVDLCVPKGKALIWAANLWHGGSAILDLTRTRYSQVTHFYFSDCMYYTPLLSDPFLGRVYYNQILNLLTGEIVPHVYNGETIDIVTENIEIDVLKHKIQQNQTDLETLKQQCSELQILLYQKDEQIREMEKSKFWQLRTQWLKLKHRFISS